MSESGDAAHGHVSPRSLSMTRHDTYTCDECKSLFLAGSSWMAAVLPVAGMGWFRSIAASSR
jgi:uncharacterized protein with PIN domain